MLDEIFPDPESADENGIVCVGGELSAPLLLEAYKRGIFPWPEEEYPLMLWFSPNPRGVLLLKDLHTPTSLQKWAKKQTYRVVLNQDFQEVIEACSTAVRVEQSGTWISEEIKAAYCDLHRMGFAYCVGVYEGESLVAGLYGVCIDGFISAESMFYKKTNTSKLGLWKWAEFLKKEGVGWVDIQMVTPISQSFGGVYVERRDFLQMLRKNLVSFKVPRWGSERGVLL